MVAQGNYVILSGEDLVERAGGDRLPTPRISVAWSNTAA